MSKFKQPLFSNLRFSNENDSQERMHTSSESRERSIPYAQSQRIGKKPSTRKPPIHIRTSHELRRSGEHKRAQRVGETRQTTFNSHLSGH